jgi:hypothetical protein
MGHSWISIAALGTFLFTCLFALAKGSAAEKLGAAWVLVIDLASDAAIALSYPNPPQIVLFGLDFLLAAGLLALAIRYSSLWLGIAMLLQATALCAHALRLTGDGPNALTWMILNNVISELMLVCIVIATAISWRARHKPPAPPQFILVNDAPAQ